MDNSTVRVVSSDKKTQGAYVVMERADYEALPMKGRPKLYQGPVDNDGDKVADETVEVAEVTETEDGDKVADETKPAGWGEAPKA